MADYIAPIQRLIEQFRRLPGVGAKTAARYAFATLNLSEEECCDFADAISGVKRDVHKCPVCHGLSASAAAREAAQVSGIKKGEIYRLMMEKGDE